MTWRHSGLSEGIFFKSGKAQKDISSCKNIVFFGILVSSENISIEESTFIKLWPIAMEEGYRNTPAGWESYVPHCCGKQYEFNSGISRSPDSLMNK